MKSTQEIQARIRELTEKRKNETRVSESFELEVRIAALEEIVWFIGEGPNPIIEQIRKLPWKAAKFDSTGNIKSVGPNDSSEEIKAYIRNNSGKVSTPEGEVKISEKGWINLYPKGAK